MAELAFIGKKEVTPEEQALLVKLGETLAHANIGLHLAWQGAASIALGIAYRKAGGQPVIHQKGLHKITPVVLIYADTALVDQILLHYPHDVNTSRWHTAMSIEELKQVITDLESVIPTGAKS